MSDKPPPASTGSFALPDHGVISLTGRDAVGFAQAQTMNDVAGLTDGQWQWNGWLTPKGRVIALFAVLRLDAQSLWLIVPDADVRALAAGLQRFVFRSKVVIAARDDLYVSGRFGAPVAASGARLAGDVEHGIEMDFGGASGPRSVRIEGTPAPTDAASLARWRAFDLQHGLPRLEASQSERWTPQQLSLERLRAFSVKKGCYPGQEIVARTHFLGQAKRGLALLRAEQPLAPGDAVAHEGVELGNVISAADAIALAVLPLEHPQPLRAHGLSLQHEALREGLAR
jgi:folate-binding protein YgfZ